jgi:hypothetical protein
MCPDNIGSLGELRLQIQDPAKTTKQARERDLVTVVNLAKHADVPAKDLLDRLP